MMMARGVLLIAALICLVLGALEIRAPGINLVALGLALWLVADKVREYIRR